MNVELELRLRDLVSGMLPKIAGNSHRSFGEIDRDIQRTQRGMDGLSKPMRLGINTEPVRQAQRDVDELRRRMNDLGNGGGGRGMWDVFKGSFLGNMASNAVSNAISGGIGFGKDILNRGMQAGATKMQFQVLAGDKQGQALYSELRKYVQDSIFGPELYDNAKQMMAFGIAAKDVMPNMKMLGDVAMGDKQRMDQLTLAFSQTTSAGKLMGNDLLQYVAAGFNPLAEISKKTGRSMANLRDDMSNGAISAAMVRDAFIQATSEGGKFHGMLDKMSQTPFGKWQAMTGSWADAKTALGSSQDRALGMIFDHMKGFVDKLPGMVERLSPAVERLLMGFDDLMPSLKDFGGSLVDMLKPVWDFVTSDNMRQLGKDLLGLGRDLSDLLAPAVRSVSGLLDEMAGWVDTIIHPGKAIKKAIKNSVEIYNHDNDKGINGYMFTGMNDSMKVDSARYKKIVDSIGAKNIFEGSGAFMSFLHSQGAASKGELKYLHMPYLTAKVPGAGGSGSSKPAVAPPSETSSAITSGGARQIIINVRSFAEHFTVNNSSPEKNGEDVRAFFTEQFLRVLQSARAAM